MNEYDISDDVTVELVDSMGNDHSIVQAARVSVVGANEGAPGGKDEGLIHYLMREKHGSPFEHNSMKFYVRAPIFVFREFQRHRVGFSYNEMSGRYSVLPGDFYIPNENRPLINVGTSSRPEMAPASPETWFHMDDYMNDAYSAAWDAYHNLLALGVANEVARMVLPVGIYSEMYVTLNLRSALNFLSLRTHRKDAKHVSRPQREIEMVAEKMEEVVEDLFPIAYRFFNQYGRVAP